MHKSRFLLGSFVLAAILGLATPLAAQQMESTSLEPQFAVIRALSASGDDVRAQPMAFLALARARQMAQAEPLALAEALRLVGHTLANQGKAAQAIPFRREAVAIWRAQGSNAESNLAKAIANLASNLSDTGHDNDESTRLHLEAISMLKSAQPNSINDQAVVMLNFANHQSNMGLKQEAETTLRAGVSLIEQDPHPNATTKIALLSNLAGLQDTPGALGSLLQTRKAIIDVYLSIKPSPSKLLGDAYQEMAGVLVRVGQDSRAEEQIRLAVKQYREAVPNDPAALSGGLQLLAASVVSQGRNKEGQSIMVEALDLLRGAAPAQIEYESLSNDAKELRVRLISGLGTQGLTLMASGEVETVEPLFIESLSLGKDLPVSAKRFLVSAQFGLGFLRVRQERFSEGITLLEDAVTAVNEGFGAADPYSLYVAQRLAMGRMAAGQVDEGITEIERIRNVLMAQPPGWNPRRSEIRQTYADFLMIAEKTEDAYAEFRDIGFELLIGPGRTASLDPAARRAFLEGRSVFTKQLQAGWNAAYDLKH
jgi:tetratricopeptide (TPR) repeat protein